LPQILDGIPLDVRSISLELGRPSFILNPTSCDPMAVGGSLTSALGTTQALSSPFQVGGCNALPFKPKLQIKLRGGTKRGDFPALSATATAKPGEANISRVSVELPHSAFLEQSHIGTVCTRVQFAQGAVPGERCPAKSIYGKDPDGNEFEIMWMVPREQWTDDDADTATIAHLDLPAEVAKHG